MLKRQVQKFQNLVLRKVRQVQTLLEVVQEVEVNNRKKIAVVGSGISLCYILLAQSLICWYYPNQWFISVAIGLFFFTYLLLSLHNSKFFKIFFELAISNLCDELFFDPEKISSNEYISAGIIVFLNYRVSIKLLFENLKIKYKKSGNETRIL